MTASKSVTIDEQALQIAREEVSTQGADAHRAIIETYLAALPPAPSLETIKAELQTALAYSGYGPSSQWAAKHGSRLIADMSAYQTALRAIADHPTGGVGCNPQTFVKLARAALSLDAHAGSHP